jgi:hypothetical protein
MQLGIGAKSAVSQSHCSNLLLEKFRLWLNFLIPNVDKPHFLDPT